MKKLILILAGTMVAMGSLASANPETPANNDIDTLRQFTAPCQVSLELHPFYRDTVVPEMKMYVEQGFKLAGVTKLDSVDGTPTADLVPNTCVFTFIKQ
ncbi:MAG: hypothetical protein NDJ90_01220 [Oligoflexia bacterium]|nr:hypothetical protein [Oligoflexia bacterium]